MTTAPYEGTRRHPLRLVQPRRSPINAVLTSDFVAVRVAIKLTGHKTLTVFKRYSIVSAGDLRDAARRLDTYTSSAAS